MPRANSHGRRPCFPRNSFWSLRHSEATASLTAALASSARRGTSRSSCRRRRKRPDGVSVRQSGRAPGREANVQAAPVSNRAATLWAPLRLDPRAGISKPVLNHLGLGLRPWRIGRTTSGKPRGAGASSAPTSLRSGSACLKGSRARREGAPRSSAGAATTPCVGLRSELLTSEPSAPRASSTRCPPRVTMTASTTLSALDHGQ
jgi:hypothetical protein